MNALASPSLRPLLLALLAGPLAATGQVLVVAGDGSGDFTHPVYAADAAQNGDTILVKDGAYGPLIDFTTGTVQPLHVDGKGVTIVAEAGSSVTFNQTEVIVEHLAASQAFVLRGFAGGLSTRFTLRDNAGAVWIEEGSWGTDGNGSAHPRVDAQGCAAVNLLRVLLRGDESIFGLPTGSSTGVTAVDSTVFAYDATFIGGTPSAFIPVVPAVHAKSGARFFGSGCALTGGSGGPGLLLDVGAVSAHLLDTTGSVQTLGGTLTTFPGAARSFAASSPVRAGQTLVLTLAGVPDDLALVGVGLAPGGFLFAPFQGAFLHAPVPAPLNLVLGVVPASGELSVPIAVPQLAPGIEAVHLYPQAGVITGAGQVILAPASAVTLLDAAF